MLTIRLTPQFESRLDDLPDKRAQVRIAARLRHAEAGNLGDCKAVGGGVSEVRVHFGPGYRLNLTRQVSLLIVMLAGGDKSSQGRDIRRAQQILRPLESEP